jgi:GNAT superfamily N-acetyltransferase
MSLENINIIPLLLKDIYQFASGFTELTRVEQIIPITLFRAKAQQKNPYSRPDDAVLFVAVKSNQVIGYLGRFPGLLFLENKPYRVFWGSTFYIMAKYRGKGIGKLLLDKMVSLNQDFVVTRITPQAEKALKRYGMKVLGSLNYFQIRVERVHFFRGLFNICKNFGSHTQPCQELTKNIENNTYKLEKRIFYAVIDGLVNKMAGNYKIQITERLKESDFFGKKYLCRPFFYRGPEVIDWMLQERWVLSRDDKHQEVSGYHFSGIKDYFKYFVLKLYCKDKRNYHGFLILCVSSNRGRTVVRVLDHLFKTSDVISGACAAVLKYAKLYQADRVELSDEIGSFLYRYFYFKRFLKKQTRKYLYFSANEKSPLEQAKKEIQLNYCDGDTTFT